MPDTALLQKPVRVDPEAPSPRREPVYSEEHVRLTQRRAREGHEVTLQYATACGTARGFAQLAERALLAGDEDEALRLVRVIVEATGEALE